MKAGAPDDKTKAGVERAFASFRKETQGYAAGVVSVVAEPTHAQQAALEKVRDALAILRFFSIAALTPTERSHCVPRGQEREERFIVLSETDGKFAGLSRGFLDPDSTHPWRIDDKSLEEHRRHGLRRLDELLNQQVLSPFENKLLASVRLYSDATTEPNVDLKLVVMLAALEGILLKNESEPIAHCIGDRLAFLTQDESEERRKVPRVVRRVYELRSRFLHHGQSADDDAAIEDFMVHAWAGLVNAIEASRKVKTVPQFAELLDDEKYGPSKRR